MLRTITLCFFFLCFLCLTNLPLAKSSTNSSKISGVVNINTASLVELVQLPGIGIHRANEIINYRSRRPFKKTSELLRIKGIGNKLLRRLAPFVTTENPTHLTVISKNLQVL